MTGIVNGITALLTLTLFMFVACLVSTAGGAVIGWIVGLCYSHTILSFIHGMGFIGPIEVWQIGAALGFVGSFFKSVNSTNN